MATCELLSVGTELLLGQILNTNAKFLSEELAAIGLHCYFQTTVGDNKARIIGCIREALNRCDVLLITGGLGPTADDLTTECVAETLGTRLELDEKVLQQIESFFTHRGVPMPQTNRKQALRPRGADLLPNPRGTAPGIIWVVSKQLLTESDIVDPDRERIILTFPGVPSEMHAMWRDTARGFLLKRFGEGVLYSVELKHYGIGESALAEKYAHLLDLANPTVAPYAGTGECRLRVTARASNVDEARKLAEPVVAEILAGSCELCYGRDNDNLETVVGRLLSEQKKTIATAESCTGGLISKRLTDVAGSSAYIKANVVTYANEMKHKLIGVPNDVLETVGAVSEECARAMAEGVRELVGADIGLSVTGIAGPGGGTMEKPVGLVYLGISDAQGTSVKRLNLPKHLGREEIRGRTSSEALNMVRLRLLENR